MRRIYSCLALFVVLAAAACESPSLATPPAETRADLTPAECEANGGTMGSGGRCIFP